MPLSLPASHAVSTARVPPPSLRPARLSRRVRCSASRSEEVDVIVVGAGHNSLVAATLLAKQGLRVEVLEERDVVGGACRTERPFAKAPELGQSTGAYLLGLMPPELMELLELDIPHMRRDPHYFLPTTDDRYLLFGSDGEATRRQITQFFSPQDWEAHLAFNEEIGALRDDLAPAWLQEPLSVEETAERYVRPGLRETFVSLCRGTVGDYIHRFGFQSDLLKAMYAMDGFIGSVGCWDTPGGGYNLLTHNMCRLPGADGTWKVVRGGMGTVTAALARAAAAAGAALRTGARVERVLVERGAAAGVALAGGRELRARAVVAGCDPFALRALAGRDAFPADYNARPDGLLRDGTSMKVNLALSDLPRFSCLPEPEGQHRATIHLLPPEGVVLQQLQQAHTDALAGRLPEFPAIDIYTQTAVDPSLTDSQGRISAAFFVQWVPYELVESSWEAQEAAYTQHLIGILDRFAPGAADLVVDAFTLTPPKIESHFGITRGHIHHVDHVFALGDRAPHATPVQGLYSASSGTHPAGSVIGCAGHNAAARLLKDWGLRQWWTVPPAPRA